MVTITIPSGLKRSRFNLFLLVQRDILQLATGYENSHNHTIGFLVVGQQVGLVGAASPRRVRRLLEDEWY